MKANSERPSEEVALSDQQYADQLFSMACEAWYERLLAEKKRRALELFEALPPQQQEAILNQLQVPDVLPTE